MDKTTGKSAESMSQRQKAAWAQLRQITVHSQVCEDLKYEPFNQAHILRRTMALLDTLLQVGKIATQVANPDLVKGLMQANVEALAVSQENLGLQKRISELESTLRSIQGQRETAQKVYRLGGFVFLEGDPDPQCPVCWDSERKLIHLNLQGYNYPTCLVCKNFVDAQPPMNPQRNNPKSVPSPY